MTIMTFRYSEVVQIRALGLLACLVPSLLWAGETSLTDRQDGWLDASAFLDTAYGFMPFVAPITEPAVGYGAAAALVFIDRNPSDQHNQYVRPNIAMVGGKLPDSRQWLVCGCAFVESIHRDSR